MKNNSHLHTQELKDGRWRLEPRFTQEKPSLFRGWGGSIVFFAIIQAVSIPFLYIGSGTSKTQCQKAEAHIQCEIQEGAFFDLYTENRYAKNVQDISLKSHDTTDGEVLTNLSLKTLSGSVPVLKGASNLNESSKRKFRKAFRAFVKKPEQMNFDYTINKLNFLGFLGTLGFLAGILVFIYPILHYLRPAFVEWNSRSQSLRLRTSVFGSTSAAIPFSEIEKIGFHDGGIIMNFFVRLRGGTEYRMRNWFQIPLGDWQKAMEPLERRSGIKLVIEKSQVMSGVTDQSLPIVIKDGSARRHKYAGIALVLSVLLSVYLIVDAFESRHWDLALLMLPFLLISGSARLMRSRVITVGNSAVRFEASGWFKTHWSEPTRNYDGIDVIETKDDNTVTRTFILRHPERQKTITLEKRFNRSWDEDRELLNDLTAKLRVPNLFERGLELSRTSPTEASPIATSSIVASRVQLPWNEEWRFVGMGMLIVVGLFFGFIGLMFLSGGISIILKGQWSGFIMVVVSLIPLAVASFLGLLPIAAREGIHLDHQRILVHNRILFYRKNVVDLQRSDIQDVGLIRRSVHGKKESYAIRLTTSSGQNDFAGHAPPEKQKELFQKVKLWASHTQSNVMHL